MKFSGFLFLFLLHRSCSVLDVVAPKTHNALIGSTTLVPCSFTVDNLPINPQFLAVLWKYGEKELVRYDNKETVATPRMSINVGEVRQGKASLTIRNVTIADQGTYKCLVIYSPNREVKEIQLNSQAVPKVTLLKKTLSKNKMNHLLCMITNFYPMDITVTWLRNGQALNGSQLGPFKIDDDGTYRVNSSLAISPTQSQDNPIITCQVDHVSLSEPIQDAFVVQYGVEPEIALFSSSDGRKEIFVCEVKEFYPEDVKITWLLDGKRMEPSRRNADGTYNTWDHVLITGDHKMGENISCVVEHEMLDSPLMKTLAVADRKDFEKPVLIAVISVLVTLLTVGILAALSILYFNKKKYFQRFQVSPIHIPGRWNENTDEKVTMCCTAFNCLKKIQVTWIVVEGNGKIVIVTDQQTQTNGECEQLLSSDYTVRTDQSETDGFYNAITSLTFTPIASDHRNMNVTCNFQSGNKTKGKHKKWSINFLRPRLSAPMKFSLDNSGDVVCSVSLEKFYPKDIQIKWSCGVGNYQELDNFKTFPNSSEDTLICGSECQVPSHLFQDPGFRVRVIWTHMSMAQPESREVSAKDLPWRPVMGEIIVPSLVHGTEARMQCEIRGYFPKNLEVRWLRREAEKLELYEVSSSDKYKIPILEITQEPDKTYTCTTSLIVSVSAITHQGAEFICRVTHPSLETPLERRTGELTVNGKSVVKKILQNDRYIVLKMDSFSTQDIKVTWERADKRSGPYTGIEEKYIQNNQTRSSDGSFSLTSTLETAGIIDIKTLLDKYFKVTIEHGALKTPEVIVFLRYRGDVYIVTEKGKTQLEKDNKDSGLEKDNKDSGSEKDNMDSGLEKDNKDSGLEKDNKDSGLEKDNMDSGLEKDNKDSGLEKVNKDSGLEKVNKDSGLTKPGHTEDSETNTESKGLKDKQGNTALD